MNDITLQINLSTIVTVFAPFMLAYIGSTVKLLVDVSAIREHLKQLNGRVSKVESGHEEHVRVCHLR